MRRSRAGCWRMLPCVTVGGAMPIIYCARRCPCCRWKRIAGCAVG
ncbi:MAG: DUF2537 domain-containing protein [Anaerolineae bacterium]|nr:DUF2537 domain-containing protein [Anaerolineae bacterium]